MTKKAYIGLGRTALIAIGILSLGACASRGAGVAAAPSNRRAGPVLVVQNQHWQDVRIYMLESSGARPVRVGTVPGVSTARLRLRGQHLATIRGSGSARLLIQPLASRQSYTTDQVLVGAGDDIVLRVENNLRFSTLWTRRRGG